MAIRITGMNSGLDTESIITQLASARSVKVNSIKKAQIKQSWKTEAWASLNSKVMKFYNETLTDMQYVSSYSKKSSTVSDSSVASVLAGSNAVVGTQTLSVKSLASAGYLTGGKVSKVGGGEADENTKLKDLGVTGTAKITVSTGKNGANSKTIEINEDMKISDLNSILSQSGLNANFDKKQGRFYISSKNTGAASDFVLTGANAAGITALSKLGLNADSEATRKKYEEIKSSLKYDLLAESVNKYLEETGQLASYNGGKGETAEGIYTKEKFAEAHGFKLDSAEDFVNFGQTMVDAITKQVGLADIPEDDWGNYPDKVEALGNLVDEWNKEFTDYHADYPNDNSSILSISTGDRSALFAAISDLDKVLSSTGMHKVDGTDATINLNGVDYTSDKNVFEINGLTITANSLTVGENGVDKPVTIKTEDDYSGIYDMVKNFIGKYNELINEMDKLYNADAAKGYDPLLSEEKAELKDSEIEEWEKKVKDSLLRRDGTLYDVKSMMTSIMLQSREVNGKKLSLSSFGVNTLGYFNAAENEKNAYHIYGDKDDSTVSGKDDQLMQMIKTDPEAVAGFFSDLAKSMRDGLFNKMKATNFSSSFTLYEDKLMKSEYCDYNKRVAKAESALNDYIDKWYDKFAKMEAAMAKVNAKQTSMSGLFGG